MQDKCQGEYLDTFTLVPKKFPKNLALEHVNAIDKNENTPEDIPHKNRATSFQEISSTFPLEESTIGLKMKHVTLPKVMI